MKKQNKKAKTVSVNKQMLERNTDSLNPNLPNSDSFDLDTYAREINIQEQNYYWQRFSAFATLHAGLFVLVTSDSISNKLPFYIIGIVLSIAWVFIQWASFFYVDRVKPLIDSRLEMQGIKLKRHWLFSKYKGASTRIGVIVTLLVFLLWIVLLISNIMT